ncbi:MAG: H-type small acid-soluble spore protein [Firmicutes bacterium HGW-Firmicutes-7]|nr:MAG: H-type small acid-soluble spore protein [Firmicutes bacterium HGW-Firmicutes-7]
MDKKRAMDIASSLTMANVTYNDAQVYIENVNETKDAASIHFLNQPEKSQEVSLSSLVEH